jgi:asparagine synthase (glutamine-hydrolysing)
MKVARIIGVGTNHSFEALWQSPDLPAPAMLTAPSKEGGGLAPPRMDRNRGSLMCGIVGGFTQNISAGVTALLHRGPDAHATIQVGEIALGHTRLAILDLDARSNQPFVYGRVSMIFNGEIWNYAEVRAELQQAGLSFRTSGDTEVVAAALDHWGLPALRKLNGMFALAWTYDGQALYLARDRFGEIPLHIAKQRPFLFASEKKALLAMGAHPQSIDDIFPGHVATITTTGMQHSTYYAPPITPIEVTRPAAAQEVARLIANGSAERRISDVPVCTLLSGGIDSAAVAYTLRQYLPNLVAYTAVYDPKSKDVQSARLVARTLGIELREVAVPLPTADDLARVISVIEMSYKAQIEIGWPCLVLAEQMHRDGFKVTFSGEGSDELWASYGFAYHALKTQDWHRYRRDLFLSQARKNFARCNKIFMAHSIECRLPFLHPPLVEYALSLPQHVVQEGKARPKAVMQDAYLGKLPAEITKRPKVAFQDGMGIKAAIERALPTAERFYRSEYAKQYA